ncbi:Cell wall assembly regulator [Tilletia horrida]|nr:Cell wall assembly regulator [Tilletia horrida]KAK0563118.1 Cell wall assembly regulator [Tilletia horrida]
MAPQGILSSISSWWGAPSSGGPSSSSSSSYNGRQDRSRQSPYSSTYSAWTTSPYNDRSAGGATANYPPQPRTSFSMARPSASVADFTNMYPTGSSSNLVSGGASNQPYDGSAATPSTAGFPRYSFSTRTPGAGAGSKQPSVSGNGPSDAYPSLRHTWNRIHKWSRRNYTELCDTLNWPATEAQLETLENTIGAALPPAVRESYLCYNGQESESKQSCSDGLFFGLTLLSLDRVAEEWSFWRAVDDDPSTGANADVYATMASCPEGWVRPVYSSRGWIPLISDNVGNYIGIDLNPHPSGSGSPGQVIAFGRDLDTKVVLWRGDGEGGWGRFLQSFAEELEAGECYTLGDDGNGNGAGVGGSSDDEEEDSIGYEPYFSNGGAGASVGGGDRGGSGAYGFRLTGEYKGWPIIEAWADRSIRFWQTVGLTPGQPNGGAEARRGPSDGSDTYGGGYGTGMMQNPGLRMAEANDEEDEAFAAAREQINALAAVSAAAASSSSSVASGSGTTNTSAVGLVSDQHERVSSSSLSAGQSHPLEDTDSTLDAIQVNGSRQADDSIDGPNGSAATPTSTTVPLIYTDDSAAAEQSQSLNGTSDANSNAATASAEAVPAPIGRSLSDTLSPPLPTSKGWRSKQKQRETDSPSLSGVASSPAFRSNGNVGGEEGGGGMRSASSGSAGSTATARRRSPPVPAAPIYLPTLEEVLQEQAALLAEDGGPPLDTSDHLFSSVRSTNPLSQSGGVAALLPTAWGGVGGLNRVLSQSQSRQSRSGASSAYGGGSGGVQGDAGGREPKAASTYWDPHQQGPGSGLNSPVPQDMS